MTATLTQDRAIALRRTADGDAAWFKANPKRSYRVRPASAAEIELERDAHGPIPKGMRAYAAIWQMEPGMRATAVFLGEADRDPNANEAHANALFKFAVSFDDK